MRHLCLFLDQFSRKNVWPHETSTKKNLQPLHPEALNFWISEHLVRKLNGGTCWIINKPKHLKTSNGPPLVAQLTASRPKSTMVLMGWIPNSVTVFKGSGHCKLVLPKLKSINLMVLPIKLTWSWFLSQKACNKKIAVWHRLSQLKHEHRPFHPSLEVLKIKHFSPPSLKAQRTLYVGYVCIFTDVLNVWHFNNDWTWNPPSLTSLATKVQGKSVGIHWQGRLVKLRTSGIPLWKVGWSNLVWVKQRPLLKQKMAQTI